MDRPNVYFLGIRTAGSAAHKAFPVWTDAMGWDATLVGVDIPRDSACATYHDFLAMMKADRLCVGTQVTAHKVRVHDCLAAELAECDPDVQLLGEVGAIATTGRGFAGFSPDMLALGAELSAMLAGQKGRFAMTELVILGGGGAGRAIALAGARLGNGRVSKITLTERSAEVRAELAGKVKEIAALNRDIDFDIQDGEANNEVVERSAPGSLIVNATGVGKDAAGSPISVNVRFPPGAVAWDLNYRGDLGFLRCATAQSGSREVMALDGWNYFVRNWFECLMRLAGQVPSTSRFERFCRASDSVRRQAVH